MTAALEAAWDELHDTKPEGWFVGRPFYNERSCEWEQYAFDPAEKAKVGVQSREWTAVAQFEVGVILELARCLREIRESRVPGWRGCDGGGWPGGTFGPSPSTPGGHTLQQPSATGSWATGLPATAPFTCRKPPSPLQRVQGGF